MKRLVLSMIPFIVFTCLMNGQAVRDTVIVTDDWRYEGQWPEGEGVRCSNKQGIFIGHFKEGSPVGMTLCISLNRDEVYYGNFKDGKRHGYGVLSRPGGFCYQGEFQDGFFEGVGKLYCPDLSVYEGGFHVGKPDFETVRRYWFSNRKEFDEQLPKIPEYKLTKGQKKFMKQVLKGTDKVKESSDSTKKMTAPLFMDLGADMFSRWVNGQLEYPWDAKMAKLDGTVKMKFTILENGELADPYVIDSSGVPSLDVEAFRVVCMSPKWSPGTSEGEVIRYTYRFPVIFILY